MSDAYVQVAPDSTGKKVQTFEGTVGANTVEAQSVVLVTSALAEKTSFAVTNADITTVASAVFAEDLASSGADKGVQVLTVQKATPADTAGTDGDYQPLLTSGGYLWTSLKGAPNTANNQVSISTAATIISSRAARRYCIIRNQDATVSGYVGIATVTTANGMLVKAGESIRIDSTALIQGIAASGTITFSYIEFYD